MGQETGALDEQIERLRGGDTLTENEVKALCDKVGRSLRYPRWLWVAPPSNLTSIACDLLEFFVLSK